MSTSHIRAGYRTVNPYLIVNETETLAAFLKEVFGAEELIRMNRPEGGIAHGAYRIGDSVIELAESCGEWPVMPGGIHLYVADTDATYRKALEHGAVSLREPADMFYGERSASVKDPSGNHWYLATMQEELSNEEMSRRAAAMFEKAEK